MTSQIDKIARLMGYSVAERKEEFNYYHIDADTVGTFDPHTNKADLMDVECALGIDISWQKNGVICFGYQGIEMIECSSKFENHPDKFTARAAAVCAVAEQIYDKGTV